MGFLDFKNGGSEEKAISEQRYLTAEERWSLRRMTQDLDDGLMHNKLGPEAEKTFNRMAERLELRPRDPFGDRAVAISSKEAEALDQFQKMYEKTASNVYPGNIEMEANAGVIRDALDRTKAPEGARVLKMESQNNGKTIPRPRPSWSR
jgi:hypothetical protein